MKINMDDFIKQWTYMGSAAAMVRHFEFQIFEFTTQAGELSKSLFSQSFTQGGFYGTGKKWPLRKSRWGTSRSHEVMRDTGILEGSLSSGGKGSKAFIVQKAAPGQRSIYRKQASYNIYVNPVSRYQHGHRGTRNEGPTTYAAVHNTDPRISGFYVNQWAARYSKRKPEHRQFIGLNKNVDIQVANLYPTIFHGFPGMNGLI